MRGANNEADIWQMFTGSWLLEEEDQDRVATEGLAIIRERDYQEFEVYPTYFDLPPEQMKEAAAKWSTWGYGSSRLWNPPLLEGIIYIKRIEKAWQETVEAEGDEADAIQRFLNVVGRDLSSACLGHNGHDMTYTRAPLMRDTELGAAVRVVLFNDTTRFLRGEALPQETAQRFYERGVVGVVMRWLLGGAEKLSNPAMGALLPEGKAERIARAALWDRHQLGRVLRTVVGEDLTVGVLEVGLERLTSNTGVGCDFGDWVLSAWWAMANEECSTSHLLCAGAKRELWPDGQHPSMAFELTDDDLELIRAWVLQHRCRLATGRWEFSPAWAFIPVIEQIFWLHGLIESEEAGYAEHNGTATGYAFEAETIEHIPDRRTRWIANDPKVNELDWRIREVILPVVEEMADEMAELYRGHSELKESGKRWAQMFYPWESDPTGYEASLLRFEEMVDLARDWLRGKGYEAGDGSDEIGDELLQALITKTGVPAAGYWGAAQGWNEAQGVNELLMTP